MLRLVAGVAVSIARTASAEPAATVSADEQARLLAKVVSYDRNFAARAIDRAKLLLVARPGDPSSSAVVMDLARTLGTIATVGGLPHSEEVTTYSDAATVANTCYSHRISIVYFGPGLEDEIEGIRRSLEAVDVLSVAAVPSYVPLGIVLGFGLAVDGVKLLLNRRQARAQNVTFGARILTRMTIYE